jgi:nucleotide-binding universal stress UspA family protein
MLVLAHSRVDVARARARQLPLAELLSEGPRLLLFVQERWSTGRRVAVLASGHGWERALERARAIAAHEGLELSILTVAGDARSEELRSTLTGTGPGGAARRLRRIAAVNAVELQRAAVAEDARLVVIPALAAMQDATLVGELLRQAECSVMTVR